MARNDLFKTENETVDELFMKAVHTAEMVNAMEQKNTMLGKSVGVIDEEKLYTDNTIPYNILNRPSPIKESRYNDFERSARLSRNRVRDTKGNRYFFTLYVSCLSSRS